MIAVTFDAVNKGKPFGLGQKLFYVVTPIDTRNEQSPTC